MTMISHLNQVNDLLAEERMIPLKCPSAVTVAAAQIACAHGMAVKKMRGSMGSPQGGGNAPGSNDTGTEHESADFFIFEDDKENIDPSTGVSARASSGTTSARDEFEVAFMVPRDPARCAEAAVGAPSRQPLADVTAKYVTPAARLSAGKAVITADDQGKFKSIALIRATDENAAPQNGGEGGAKPAAIGLKRSVGARADPAKKARVLRFVIR
mmetsp:Transcript_7109/g.32093  ORF Transcript_7109/g.32093 Transcript_7109/m.32093 type:complete len:213 (-) Transcript_7109:293-931(-)